MALTADINGNPIKVTGTTDTADTIHAPTGIPIYVKYIRWYNITTTGDLCHIYDETGRTIIKMIAESDGSSQQWEIMSGFAGLYCDDLDSGELYIYIR